MYQHIISKELLVEEITPLPCLSYGNDYEWIRTQA